VSLDCFGEASEPRNDEKQVQCFHRAGVTNVSIKLPDHDHTGTPAGAAIDVY
jgi:hypothetical protein